MNKIEEIYNDVNYDVCDTYIINDVQGIKKPFIEKYLNYKNRIENVLNNNDNVLFVSVWEDDVSHDYDFEISMNKDDNVIDKIRGLINSIEEELRVDIHVMKEQIIDSIDDADTDVVCFDLFCNLK